MDLATFQKTVEVSYKWDATQEAASGLTNTGGSSGTSTLTLALPDQTAVYDDEFTIQPNHYFDFDLADIFEPASNFNVSFGFLTVHSIMVFLLPNDADAAGAVTIADKLRVGEGDTTGSYWMGWLGPTPASYHDIDGNFGLPYVAGSADGRGVTQPGGTDPGDGHLLRLSNLDLTTAAKVRLVIGGAKR